MAGHIYADVVVGVPFGDQGKKRWVKIGAMIQMEKNDASRGPGFVIMLDRYVNLAGFPQTGTDQASVAASTFWPKEKDGTAAPPATTPRGQASRRSFDDPEDDIPF